MAAFDLRDLAKRGAAARLTDLKAEEAAILKAFPELKRGAGRSDRADGKVLTTGKRKRSMSASQKKEVSRRMKAYWAKRRQSSKRA